MKNKWLNLVLVLTNRIYDRKQGVVAGVGLGSVYGILVLVFLELVLAVVSLPLYLGMKPDNVTTFLEGKGSYAEVAFDYSLRRVLTLTGVGIFALIWAFKLALIVFLPPTYGPLQLYSVSDFRPADITQKELVMSEVGIQTARVVETMPRPELLGVEHSAGGNYSFTGKGAPGLSVVLLLSDRQTAVYTAEVGSDESWIVEQSQDSFRLSEGNHSILVFSYDKTLGTRSSPAPLQYFKVTTTWWDSVAENVDSLTNWSVVIVILLGALLTFLTV